MSERTDEERDFAITKLAELTVWLVNQTDKKRLLRGAAGNVEAEDKYNQARAIAQQFSEEEP